MLNGFPADQVGLLRGDRILSVDGQAFQGTWGSVARRAVVDIDRDGRRVQFDIEIQLLNWPEAFLSATRSSVRVLAGRVGYVRFWTGTHPRSVEVLRKIVSDLKPRIGSLILDLRGGYGGAWWDHLDPFFSDSSSYFIAQVVDVDGNIDEMVPPSRRNLAAFNGLMAVLINEGVRSGKEALAYQFKKTGRARLFGTRTPGYITVGKFLFTNEPVDYALYLCWKRVTLDNIEIEGVGIGPDVEVSFSTSGSLKDSQIEAAAQYFKSL